MYRTVIADDHAMFREGLKFLLREDPRFVIIGEAEDGAEALELLDRERPDLAVLDVALPRMNGIDVVRGAAARALTTKCMMLTMHDEPEIAANAIASGARAYILKDHTFEELKAAAEAVMDGGTFVSPRIADSLRRTADARQTHDGPLTAREREIVSLIARGMANKEIADGLAISIRTVEAHRARIMRKLGIRSHAGLIYYAARWKITLLP